MPVLIVDDVRLAQTALANVLSAPKLTKEQQEMILEKN